MSYWCSMAACYSSKVEETIRIRYRTPRLSKSLAHICKPELAFKIKKLGLFDNSRSITA